MKALETIARTGMLEKGDSVVAGVSGGADSMALLHLLCSLREKLELRVCAAHINHGLRGAEADADEEYVRRVCSEWGVPFDSLRADVAAQAEASGESVEEAGRRVRYAFFQKIAQPMGAKIATAHTLSDSMETVLLNLARGTGLKGLCGIPPVRDNIIRPLIETTRGEIESYCREFAILYRNDSTNRSREYARNRIRLDAVPALYCVNPSFDRAALRTMRILSQEEELLEQLARAALEQAASQPSAYRIGPLLCAPAGLLPRVLAAGALKETGVTQETRHIEALAAIVRASGGAVSLKGGRIARVAGGELLFESEKPGRAEKFCVPLCEGIYKNAKFGMKITILTKNEIENLKNVHNPYFKNILDCDKILGKAVIRSRKPGERYFPAGRGVCKTLKKLFYEAGIPPEDRSMVPVVADEKGIVWVYGSGADERCRVTDRTKNAYYVTTTDVGGF